MVAKSSVSTPSPLSKAFLTKWLGVSMCVPLCAPSCVSVVTAKGVSGSSHRASWCMKLPSPVGLSQLGVCVPRAAVSQQLSVHACATRSQRTAACSSVMPSSLRACVARAQRVCVYSPACGLTPGCKPTEMSMIWPASAGPLYGAAEQEPWSRLAAVQRHVHIKVAAIPLLECLIIPQR